VWEWEELGYKGGWEEFRKEAIKKVEQGDGELDGWITKRPKREKKSTKRNGGAVEKERKENKVEKGKGREKVSFSSTRSLPSVSFFFFRSSVADV